MRETVKDSLTKAIGKIAEMDSTPRTLSARMSAADKIIYLGIQFAHCMTDNAEIGNGAETADAIEGLACEHLQIAHIEDSRTENTNVQRDIGGYFWRNDEGFGQEHAFTEIGDGDAGGVVIVRD